MKSPIINIVHLLSILGALFSFSWAGYGDKFPGGYPNWQERAVITLVNSCRMAPQQYRDKYIGNYNILLPTNFPAVRPLFWNLALNTSARVHALDMGSNCDSLMHNSCDGTTFAARIESYYTKSPDIAENIAYGSPTPQGVMSLWIMETGGTTPVPDGPSAGHRINLMSAIYKEMGAGYDYGSKTKHYWWVQDFGAGKPDYTHTVPCASHCFMAANTITFYANYFDSLGKPKDASVFIDNVKYPMTLDIGKDSAGTYAYTTTKASACRLYYFSFSDAKGTVWRYPETGFLITQGEGSCAKDFVAAESLGVDDEYGANKKQNSRSLSASFSASKLFVRCNGFGSLQGRIVVTNLKGQIYKEEKIPDNTGPQLLNTTFSIPMTLPHGLFLVVVRFSNSLTHSVVIRNL